MKLSSAKINRGAPEQELYLMSSRKLRIPAVLGGLIRLWFAFIKPRPVDFAIKACSLPTAFAIYSGMPKFLCQDCGAKYLQRRSNSI